jgi:asparagine synthase (glutamine-hydrolysing)
LPGINILLQFGSPKPIQTGLSSVMKMMRYDDTYFEEYLYTEPAVNIVFSGYKEYPKHKIDCQDKIIFIDGIIYNKTANQIKNALLKTVPECLDNTRSSINDLSDFIINSDGEYIIYFLDIKSCILVIINDCLGRLPLYYYFNRSTFISGRSLKFIVQNLPAITIDREALMEYISFLAPMGNKTFFKGIYRLMPATMLIIDYKSGNLTEKQLYAHNFDNRMENPKIDFYIQHLKNLFLEASKSRIDYIADKKIVLALSGGLDSRAVLLSLLNLKADFENVTFRDQYGNVRRELSAIKELANNYSLKHRLYDLPSNDLSKMEKLIYMMDGMSINGIMGIVLHSLELLQKIYGKDFFFLTGAGGGYILGPRFTGRKIASLDQLTRELFNKNSIFSVEEISRLIGKRAEDILNYFYHYFENYPEKSLQHKYDRFYIFEHLFKFSMKGEDRERRYFWSTTPLYGSKFTTFAFKISNDFLKDWKIYREFLRALDKKSIKIKYSNWGLALDSPLLPFYLPLRKLLLKNMKIKNKLIKTARFIRHPLEYSKKLNRKDDIDELKQYLKNMIEHEKHIDDYLDKEYLKTILLKESNTYRMYLLINIIKYFSNVYNKIRYH